MVTDSYVSIVALLLLRTLPVLANEVNLATTVYPMMNQYLPVNSDTNVTFNCSVQSHLAIVWSVNGTQISHDDQFVYFMNLGYAIEPMNAESSFSTMTVSATDANSVLECLPFHNHIRWCQDCSEEYSVVTYDTPTAPTDFTIQPSLMLLWTRPSNVPLQVSTYYTIEINSTEDGGMNFRNFTSDTYLPVQFLEELLRDLESECVEFEFFVSATNDAGTGPSVRVVDTVPISPDVTDINRELKVEAVYIQSETAAVNIMFPAVKPCSDRFPITNYTLNIDEEVHSFFVPDNTTHEPSLTSQLILPQDHSFSLSLKACSDVTCRTSDSRIINTTDVQSVEVAFYDKNLYLKCVFAKNSQAKGCIFELILKDSNITERFNVTRQSGSMHTTSNNQREAYGSVFVSDWEEDGVDGNFTFNITGSVSVLMMAEFIAQTGFDNREGPDEDDGINVMSVTIAVPVAVVVTLGIMALFVLVLIIWLARKFNSKKELGEVEITEEVDADTGCVTYEFHLKSTKLIRSFKQSANNNSSIDGGHEENTSSPSLLPPNDKEKEKCLPPFQRWKSCNNDTPPNKKRASNDPKVQCELELDTKFVRLKFHQTAYKRMHSAPASEGSTGESCSLKISKDLQKLLSPGEVSGSESGESSDSEETVPDTSAGAAVVQLKLEDTQTDVSGNET